MNSFKLASDHFARGVSTLLGKEVPNTLVSDTYPDGYLPGMVLVESLFRLFDSISEKYGETRLGETFVKKTVADLEVIFFRAGLRVEETVEERDTEIPLGRYIRKAALAFEEVFFSNLRYYKELENFSIKEDRFDPVKYLRAHSDTYVWHDNSMTLAALDKIIKVANATEFFENASIMANVELTSIAINTNAGSLNNGFYEHFLKTKFLQREAVEHLKKSTFVNNLSKEQSPESIRKLYLLIQNALFTIATIASKTLRGHFPNEIRYISLGNGHIRNLGRRHMHGAINGRVDALEINLNAKRVFISFELLSSFSDKVIKRGKSGYMGATLANICVDIGIEIAKQLLQEDPDHLLNIMFNKEKATYVG